MLGVLPVSASIGRTRAEHRPGPDSVDRRAKEIVARATLDEKIRLVHGSTGGLQKAGETGPYSQNTVDGAGYVPGIARLNIPALHETDASMGVGGAGNDRAGPRATAFPANLALAATFDPALAGRSAGVIASEARAKGFNVLLGGGMNLTRDQRGGRNFEYLGEDPLLAGTIAGEQVAAVQRQGILSTIKHFALNAHETNRKSVDARIDRAALRESDLLAFQFAIERGHPASIMCAYNRVNGPWACGNAWLLNDVLKTQWGYKGWVMSDWGAVHATDYALNGLDQQSGEQIDKQVWFGNPLRDAVVRGDVPMRRLDDMAYRIVRSMLAVGITDDTAPRPIDYPAHAQVALQVAREGIVLLKNDARALPLAPGIKRIALIGGNAQFGVLSGGGSSQVKPSNGETRSIHIGGPGEMEGLRREIWFPSSPNAELQKRLARTEIIFDPGQYPDSAAALARSADIAIVFATQYQFEGADVPSMTLPSGQDELIKAVAAANRNTIVVLETGDPVAMPWLKDVRAVLAAWYPGQEGGRAIAEILTGEVNPSGHLPITFPIDDAQSQRPALPNLWQPDGADVAVDYVEGSDVGYRWYARERRTPAFSFGHGLSYTDFTFSDLTLRGGKTISVTFSVKNIGAREGAAVPQVYLTNAAGRPVRRLIGFARADLKPGERRSITLQADPRLLGRFDEASKQWIVAPGTYGVMVGRSADAADLTGSARLQGRRLAVDWTP